jgi:hypothetical protein
MAAIGHVRSPIGTVWLSVNSLVGEVSLRFYRVVQLIKCHCNVSGVD